ncbi:hypothetical protein PR202_ga24127 [Eleusine coracana subsp. coracana]|uniref:Uncharacterized protein n=1 Tax=Eleusine coracana subsp. coracana TaxID=191504 RepID=A0AAV5D6V1_ELECO|nr:hypothetical protein PR202_ga24127 [Eleusine coracana subsp. coracana]
MRALDPSTSSRATRHNTQPSRAVRLMLIPPSLLPSKAASEQSSPPSPPLHCTVTYPSCRRAAFPPPPPPSLSPRTLSERPTRLPSATTTAARPQSTSLPSSAAFLLPIPFLVEAANDQSLPSPQERTCSHSPTRKATAVAASRVYY